jgi:hypothetical protein
MTGRDNISAMIKIEQLDLFRKKRKCGYKFVKTAVKKAGWDAPFGFVNGYVIAGMGGLDVLRFSGADKEWLHCICSHRRENSSARLGNVSTKLWMDNPLDLADMFERELRGEKLTIADFFK